MFPEIHSGIKFDQRGDLSKHFLITVLETENIDGSFILHHFVSLAVQKNLSIVFLGLQQTKSHYHVIGLKLGINLFKYSKLTFIEALKNIYKDYLSRQSKDFSRVLQDYFEEIKRYSTENDSLIVIDKLDPLIHLGCSNNDIYHFIMNLKTIENATIVIVSAHNEIGVFIAHCSDVKIRLWPLSTGYCESVSGNLKYIWTTREYNDSEAFQYKIYDKNVKTFALGLSSNVI